MRVLSPSEARMVVESAHAGPLLRAIKIIDAHRDSYWRDRHGSLHKLFPKKKTDHRTLWKETGNAPQGI